MKQLLRTGFVMLCLLGCGNNAASLKASPRGVALPGACVDPLPDAQQRIIAIAGDNEVEPASNVDVPDLDGNGERERAFTGGAVSGYNENALLYIMRGKCGHFVGNVQNVVTELPTPVVLHHGLPDLRVPEASACEGARCGCTPGETWWRFDGTVYVQDKSVSKASVATDCPE